MMLIRVWCHSSFGFQEEDVVMENLLYRVASSSNYINYVGKFCCSEKQSENKEMEQAKASQPTVQLVLLSGNQS